jgi:hypothetical protein
MVIQMVFNERHEVTGDGHRTSTRRRLGWPKDDPTVRDTVTSGPLTAFVNGWQVRAVFTNGGGSATTNAATITVT